MPAVHLHGDKTKQVRQATRRVTVVVRYRMHLEGRGLRQVKLMYSKSLLIHTSENTTRTTQGCARSGLDGFEESVV